MSFETFRQRFLDALRTQELPDYIKKPREEIVADVAAHLTPVIEAQMLDEGPTGRSKIGGVPDVPAGFAWPTEQDNDAAPLTFVAQIDLAEVHPHDLDHQLPETGMLWVFSIADGDRAYSYEIDDSTTALVYHPAPGELVPAEVPALEGEEIEPRGLAFGPSFSIGKRFDGGVEDAIRHAIEQVGGRNGPVRMLGSARFFREENKGAFDAGSDVVLVALDGYAIASQAFGEGSFTWFLARSALAAGKLDGAGVVFEPGT